MKMPQGQEGKSGGARVRVTESRLKDARGAPLQFTFKRPASLTLPGIVRVLASKKSLNKPTAEDPTS